MVTKEVAFRDVSIIVEGARLTKKEHLHLDECLKLIHEALFPAIDQSIESFKEFKASKLDATIASTHE